VVARAGEQDELPGIFDRQPAQQHLVDECEDRRVRADAKRDGQERYTGEEGRARQPTEGVPKIANDLHKTFCHCLDDIGRSQVDSFQPAAAR
jgi:hypothetical protein